MSATDLEKRVAELEKRAKAAEGKLSSAGGAGESSADTLKRLNEVRDAVLADQREAQTVAAQKSDLEKEFAKLQEENHKLKYQILHLKRSLDEKDP